MTRRLVMNILPVYWKQLGLVPQTIDMNFHTRHVMAGSSATTDHTTTLSDNPTMAVSDYLAMAVSDNPTMAVRNNPNMPVSGKLDTPVSDNPTMAVSNNPTMVVSDKLAMAVNDNPTVAASDNPIMAVSDNPTDGNVLHHENEAVLYVHWPYCARRCSYCNFNKYISKSVDHTRMADCLARETQTLLQMSGVQKINSIFFGGGTPSLALPSTVARVIDTVKKHVTFSPGTEVTLEANPTKLETDRLQNFKEAGVTRLSLGLQALNEDDLHVLGRDHNVGEALSCLEKARALFPGQVSVDLIFGRPGQTLAQWTHELKQLLAVCDKHVSLYQLTLERGTQLFKWVQAGRFSLPDTDTMADMYIDALQILEDHGLYRYEVSNFAQKGYESRHNEAYWQGKQYIGVGPGAHGRFIPQKRVGDGVPMREARIQTLEPPNWMVEVERYGHGTRKVVPQTLSDRLEEMIMLGLRTTDGIPNTRWGQLSGDRDLATVFGSSPAVQDYIQTGLLELDTRGLRATSSGLIVIDSLLPYLLDALAEIRSQPGVVTT